MTQAGQTGRRLATRAQRRAARHLARAADLARDLPYEVDAITLVHLAGLRRALRTLLLITTAAAPVLALSVILIQESVDRSSSAWDVADDAWVPGFQAIGVLLVSLLASLLALNCAGRTGRTACRLVPTFHGGPEPVVRDGTRQVRGLVAVLRRKPFFSVGQLLLAVLFVLVGLGATINIPSAWQASRGQNGLVVTIGEEAVVSRTVDGARGPDTYFLRVLGSEVVAEGIPRDGEKWTVVDDDGLGNRRAYEVGGLGWLAPVFAAAMCWIVLAGLCWFVGNGVGAERKARRRAGREPWESSVDELRGGARPSLQVGTSDPVVLGVGAFPTESVHDHLARRRRTFLAYVGSVSLVPLVTIAWLWN